MKDIDCLQFPIEKTDYAENIYWVYGVVLKDEIKTDTKEIMKFLGEEGIATRSFFWCMHEQPIFKKMNLFVGEKYPNAEKLARRGFYIPSGLVLTDDDQEYVAEKLKKVFNKVR